MTNKSRLQNSFSFLSNINQNNLSFSVNVGRKKMPKILNNRKNLEVDLNNSNNQNTYSNTNTQSYSNVYAHTSPDAPNLNKMVSIDRYNTVKTETMSNYRTELIKKDEEKDEDKLNGGLFGNQSVVESSKNSMDGKNPYENSLIQVHIKDKNYGNPQESKSVLGTNKFIFDNLTGSLIDIQRIFYDKTVKDIENYHKWKLKMQKIRVSTLVPKTTVEKIPKQKENSIISEEANEDVEKEGEEEAGEEDDYLEKKKEKEKQKQKKLKQNRQIEDAKVKKRSQKNDDYELYAEYKYSNKIFPEGREQFTFKYNLVDVVMFGGLIMNKNNNNLWTFDPCN